MAAGDHCVEQGCNYCARRPRLCACCTGCCAGGAIAATCPGALAVTVGASAAGAATLCTCGAHLCSPAQHRTTGAETPMLQTVTRTHPTKSASHQGYGCNPPKKKKKRQPSALRLKLLD